MGFFDFGDPLGNDFSGQVEIDRWLFLDKQIYGMMSVLGNGVITGWNVTTTGNFSVTISEGRGNVNWIAATSDFPFVIENVPPNSISYIYAKAIRSTNYDESVEFSLLSSSSVEDPNYLLLARVITDASGITSVDNSVRDVIDFIDMIRETIRTHKHRGGSLNPSKIDLTSEVKGQLPSFRIADFDADKITSGTLELGRLPLISHNDLQNIGLLTHPQLDTFVKTLEASNKELFGEIGTSNLLQIIIALKLIYDDPASAFYIGGEVVDRNMINEIAIIPGITPNENIDFENSTADINLIDHYIQGLPSAFGTSFYVRWEDKLAWNNAFYMENLAISGDAVTLAITSVEDEGVCSPQTCQIIENFDSDPTGGFTQSVLVFKDGQFVDGADDDAPDGGQVGQFDPSAEVKLIFVKLFDPIEDWSQWETFLLDVKTASNNHEAVRYFFVDETGAGDISGLFNGTVSSDHKTPDFLLLEKNYQTQNPNPLRNDYETRTVDISAIGFRDKIKGIVLWTDSLSAGFTFRIDNMRITRSLLLPESGLLKLRYSTSTSVTFSRIEFTTTEPEGTNILVKARSANGTVLLNRASFTNSLTSGSDINLSGTDIEIDIQFTPDINRQLTPILESVKLLIITDAEIDGFTINTQDEFSRGEANNVDILNSTLTINPPISIDSYCFGMEDKVLQIHEDVSTNPSHTDGELLILGVNAPIAPNQIFRSIELEEKSVNESILYFPRSVKRLYDKSFIIADSYNDRVLHFDIDNNLVEGFGSINYQADTIFPISACVDIRTGILYIAWSKSISFKSVNINRFLIQYGSNRIPLIQGYDLINNKLPSDLTTSDRGQILSIYLSETNQSLIGQLPQSGATITISPDAVNELINEQSIFYQKAITASGGLPLFIGNFWYTDINSPSNMPLFCPTYVEKTDKDTYLVTNAKVAIKDFDFPSSAFVGRSVETVTKNSETSTFPSVMEIDPTKSIQKVVFTTNYVDFSPFVPGRASKINSTTLLVAGLNPTGEAKQPTGDFNFRTVIGDDETKNSQKLVLDEIFFGSGDKGYIGAVRTISTFSDGGAEIFKYNSSNGLVVSDADTDNVGNIVVAESSFKGRSGRIIKLDSSGNIIFSYGEGLFSIINDIEIKDDDRLIISS